jgi:DNA-binding NarL/FixJ family response regulator
MIDVDGIVVDPDANRRTQLKQACFGVPKLKRIDASKSLDEALRKLSVGEASDYTAIFISKRFKKEEIADFIKAAKETPRGQDSAYVLVLLPDDQESQVMSEGLLDGADSFLLEPFSVETLNKTADLAVEIKQKRQDLREKAAVNILIKDLLKHVDIVSERLVRSQEGGPEFKYLKDLKIRTNNLNERMLELYKEYLPKLLEDQPAPTLTLKQEASVKLSTKHRIQLKAIERLKARGIDVSSYESETPQISPNNLWQVENIDANTIRIKFAHELYDKPTSDSFYSYISKLDLNSFKILELDLSKTKVMSGYALNQIFKIINLVKEKQIEIRMVNLSGFNQELYDILRLDLNW